MHGWRADKINVVYTLYIADPSSQGACLFSLFICLSHPNINKELNRPAQSAQDIQIILHVRVLRI